MTQVLAHLYSNPLAPLYTLQSITYIAAAILSKRAGHNDLCMCYSVSAFIHGGFAGCHLLHLG